MLKKSFYILSLIIIIFVGKTAAQQPLTLEQCRQMALENNKSLKAASEEEKVAYYQKKEAFLNFFPKASASGMYLHFSDDLHLIGRSSIPAAIGGIPIPDPIQEGIYDAGRIDMSDFWVAGVSVTQPIFAGGKIIAYNDLRAYAQDLAKSQKDSKIENVIVEVDEAYWQVVSLANKKKLAESYVSLLRKLDSDISEMETEGVATKADRLSVSVKLNEAEMTLTKATNGVSISKMLLSQLCGLAINDNITLSDENLNTLTLDNEADPIVVNVDDALTNRIELKSLDLVTKIYKQQEKIALSEFLPTAGVSLGYNMIKPNLHDGVENKFGGMWNVGVKVSVPLNFISSSAKLNAAKAQTRIKQFEIEDVKDKIKLQVNQSAYKLIEANKKLVSATKNTEKADENLRYANVGFEEGVIPASDALAAHTAWIAAHAERIDAQIDVKLCRIYLDKSLGKKLK